MVLGGGMVQELRKENLWKEGGSEGVSLKLRTRTETETETEIL